MFALYLTVLKCAVPSGRTDLGHVWIYEIIRHQRRSSQWTSWPFSPHLSVRRFCAHSFIWKKMFECQRVLMETSRVKLDYLESCYVTFRLVQVLLVCFAHKIIKSWILNQAGLSIGLIRLIISGFNNWLQWVLYQVHQMQRIKIYYPFLTLI